jgi:hypothetical protein
LQRDRRSSRIDQSRTSWWYQSLFGAYLLTGYSFRSSEESPEESILSTNSGTEES